MKKTNVVGAPVPRQDADPKVRGKARYIDDYQFPGQLHAALVTSPHPHARVVSIDTADATLMPGVEAVLTWQDVPGQNIIGCVFPDQPFLAQDTVRFVGDRVAIVVGESVDQARRGARAVKVEYDLLDSVHDLEEALKPDTVKIHGDSNLLLNQKVRHGKGKDGFAGCEVVVEHTFRVNYQEHAYLEPQGVAAVPDGDRVMIMGSMQCPFYVQGGVARMLGIDKNGVQVIQTTTGGGFGGKEDYPTEVAACAALAAHHTGKPVKMIFTRAEDMQYSTKRHRMTMHYRVGAMKDGTLKALDARILVDAGGYAGLSTVVAERSNSTAAGPYRFEHAHVDTLIIYTNNLFGGAFRGFGNPQVTFATENMMEMLAIELNMDSVDLRRKNLLQEGDLTITGQPLPPSLPANQVFDTLLENSGYQRLKAEAEEFNKTSTWKKRGVGLALSLYGCALHAGGQHLEGSGALVQVLSDGSVEVNIGGTELGQGAFTVVAQMAAETLGARYEKVRVLPTDTRMVPDSGPTVASRTTLMSGNAVRGASLQLLARLKELAGALLSVPSSQITVEPGVYRAGDKSIPFADLCNAAFRRKLSLFASGWYAPPPKDWNTETGQGTAYSVYSLSGHVALAEVDLLGGLTKVKKLVACHDVGKVVNPTTMDGQAQGGMVQGMGWALSENLMLDKGRCLNPGFSDYLIPSALDVPEMEAWFVEDPYPDGPFGVKGIGEPSLISVPTAVALSVGHACDFTPTRLPVTPETVLRWVHDRKKTAGDAESTGTASQSSCRRLPFSFPD